MKRLTSLMLALIMVWTLAAPAAAIEDAAVYVRSAPLVKSSSVLDGMVRVYLSSLGSVTNLDVTVVGSYSVSGAVNMTLYDGQIVHFSFTAATGQITMTVNGATYSMGSEVTLHRHQSSGQSALKIAQANRPSNLYPGDLQLVSRASGSSYKLYPIVHVYIEYYLYGVVPYEMSSSWPLEALKAQAVAARTYTLNRMNGRESNIYDLVDTTSDQVYNGHAGTETNATRAVDATKGIVIMNNGKLSGTYYTASNGGQTEAVANAWGSTAYPYLGVKDDPFDLANPSSNTRKLIVYSAFQNSNQNSTLKSLLLQKAKSLYGSSISIASINSVTPHTPKYDAPSRLYTRLDFGVTLTNGSAATLSFSIFDELESALSMSLNSSKNELWYVERDGSNFIIRAARYGHGIGMSQRGAQQMATMGYTYDQILGFYYEGCERIQYTFTHTILPPVGSGGGPVVSTEAPATIAPESGCNARIQLVGTADVLPLRYTPSESGKILICAANGSSVSVLNYGSSWTLIQYGQINGYVPTASLAFTSTPPTGSSITATNITQWATVTGSTSLNLRDGAGYNSTIIGSIPGGTPLAIFVNNGDWAQVQYGQTVGYCAVSYLTLHSSYPGSVTSSGSSAMVSLPGSTGSAPLRITASTSGTIILYVDHGTQVTVHSNDGTWCRVSVSGVTGYMLVSALNFDATGTTPTEPPLNNGEQYAIVASDASTLNLRSGPATSYDIIAEIPKGTQIVVTSYGSTWCAVRWGSLTGYVMTQYLSFGSVPTATPTPAVTSVPSGSPALLISNADMYTSASTGSTIQLMIPSGQTVTVLTYGDAWTQISYAGMTGYVLTSTLQLYQDMPTDAPATATPTPTASPTATPTATPAPTFMPTNAPAIVLLNAFLRKEPDASSAAIATIPAGARVTVTAYNASWSQVYYNGQTGWVLTSQLNMQLDATASPSVSPTATPAAPTPTTEVIADTAPTREPLTAWINTTVTSVNLRQTASDSAAILASIPAAECITVLEAGATWSRISCDGMTGYVYTQHISYTEPLSAIGIRYVCTEVDPLSLRSQPSTQSSILARIPRGSAVTLLREQGDWCFVQYGQLQGYCAAKYLSLDKPGAIVQDDTRLLDRTLAKVTGWTGLVYTPDESSIFIRQWCTTVAPEVREIQHDTLVTILEKGDIWCLITYEGDEGYCLTSQLKLIPSAE